MVMYLLYHPHHLLVTNYSLIIIPSLNPMNILQLMVLLMVRPRERTTIQLVLPHLHLQPLTQRQKQATKVPPMPLLTPILITWTRQMALRIKYWIYPKICHLPTHIPPHFHWTSLPVLTDDSATVHNSQHIALSNCPSPSLLALLPLFRLIRHQLPLHPSPRRVWKRISRMFPKCHRRLLLLNWVKSKKRHLVSSSVATVTKHSTAFSVSIATSESTPATNRVSAKFAVAGSAKSATCVTT